MIEKNTGGRRRSSSSSRNRSLMMGVGGLKSGRRRRRSFEKRMLKELCGSPALARLALKAMREKIVRLRGQRSGRWRHLVCATDAVESHERIGSSSNQGARPPVAISTTVQPSDQMSDSNPCSFCSTTSGAIHCGVPFIIIQESSTCSSCSSSSPSS